MLANRKVGHWCWALSGEEAVTALVVSRALREKTKVSAAQRSLYEAMQEKQRKLLAINAKRAQILEFAPRWNLS